MNLKTEKIEKIVKDEINKLFSEQQTPLRTRADAIPQDAGIRPYADRLADFARDAERRVEVATDEQKDKIDKWLDEFSGFYKLFKDAAESELLDWILEMVSKITGRAYEDLDEFIYQEIFTGNIKGDEVFRVLSLIENGDFYQTYIRSTSRGVRANMWNKLKDSFKKAPKIDKIVKPVVLKTINVVGGGGTEQVVARITIVRHNPEVPPVAVLQEFKRGPDGGRVPKGEYKVIGGFNYTGHKIPGLDNPYSPEAKAIYEKLGEIRNQANISNAPDGGKKEIARYLQSLEEAGVDPSRNANFGKTFLDRLVSKIPGVEDRITNFGTGVDQVIKTEPSQPRKVYQLVNEAIDEAGALKRTWLPMLESYSMSGEVIDGNRVINKILNWVEAPSADFRDLNATDLAGERNIYGVDTDLDGRLRNAPTVEVDGEVIPSKTQYSNRTTSNPRRYWDVIDSEFVPDVGPATSGAARNRYVGARILAGIDDVTIRDQIALKPWRRAASHLRGIGAFLAHGFHSNQSAELTNVKIANLLEALGSLKDQVKDTGASRADAQKRASYLRRLTKALGVPFETVTGITRFEASYRNPIELLDQMFRIMKKQNDAKGLFKLFVGRVDDMEERWLRVLESAKKEGYQVPDEILAESRRIFKEMRAAQTGGRLYKSFEKLFAVMGKLAKFVAAVARVAGKLSIILTPFFIEMDWQEMNYLDSLIEREDKRIGGMGPSKLYKNYVYKKPDVKAVISLLLQIDITGTLGFSLGLPSYSIGFFPGGVSFPCWVRKSAEMVGSPGGLESDVDPELLRKQKDRIFKNQPRKNIGPGLGMPPMSCYGLEETNEQHIKMYDTINKDYLDGKYALNNWEDYTFDPEAVSGPDLAEKIRFAASQIVEMQGAGLLKRIKDGVFEVLAENGNAFSAEVKSAMQAIQTAKTRIVGTGAKRCPDGSLMQLSWRELFQTPPSDIANYPVPRIREEAIPHNDPEDPKYAQFASERKQVHRCYWKEVVEEAEKIIKSAMAAQKIKVDKITTEAPNSAVLIVADTGLLMNTIRDEIRKKLEKSDQVTVGYSTADIFNLVQKINNPLSWRVHTDTRTTTLNALIAELCIRYDQTDNYRDDVPFRQHMNDTIALGRQAASKLKRETQSAQIVRDLTPEQQADMKVLRYRVKLMNDIEQQGPQKYWAKHPSGKKRGFGEQSQIKKFLNNLISGWKIVILDDGLYDFEQRPREWVEAGPNTQTGEDKRDTNYRFGQARNKDLGW